MVVELNSAGCKLSSLYPIGTSLRQVVVKKSPFPYDLYIAWQSCIRDGATYTIC